jgi:carboxyl-terminal processing protease
MKQKNSILILLIATSFSLFGSCRKNLSDSEKIPATFADVFEIFWNKVNTSYVFWDTDTTNWNAAYYRYKPLFSSLHLDEPNDVKKSVRLFRELCSGLLDSHFYIDFTHPFIKDSIVYPALDRKRAKPSFYNPYSYYTVVKNYLDSGYHEGVDNTSHPGATPLYCLSGTINNKALYFHCSSFKLLRSIASTTNNNAKPVINFFLNELKAPSPGIRAIIVDLRNNPGGDLSDLNFFTGSFSDTPIHFGYTRHKSNDGRLDYSPWVKAYVQPRPGASRVNLPVLVLIDSFSGSMAELIAMSLKTLPGSKLIGERTWGATGPITLNEVYNDGQFNVPNFLSVTAASACFKYIDSKIYESIGFPPDVSVAFNKSMLDQGYDAQLERALQEIQ